MQKTVKQEASISGMGLFTGEEGAIRLLPAPPGTGIVFERIDLPGRPKIPAILESVKDTFRSTRLSAGGADLCMVEHLLAALSAYGIDNVRVEVKGPEIPACDGSSRAFVEMLDQAGVLHQDAPEEILEVEEPLFWSDRGIHLVALPSPEFRISYTLHYPQSKLIGSQFYTFQVSRDSFREEIAPCRTFALYEEIAPLIEKGFIRGGRLENAVIVKGDTVLNPEGLRFANEMVRHKILDLIGDLKLIGKTVRAHIISICSGHTSNIALAERLCRIEPALRARKEITSQSETARKLPRIDDRRGFGAVSDAEAIPLRALRGER